jgi:ATP/maltotriose-dependent transcriptional regulator MalT
MVKISSVRLAVPKTAAGEIIRKKLIDQVLNSQSKIAYIHAGAGYGKTTLLSQLADSMENSVWLTLDGESDVFAFLNILSEALQQSFPDYDFTASEYLPFERKNNFITILANAFINSIEKLSKDFIIILDDLHTIEEPRTRSLIACILKYKPENIRLYLSSREAPWQELVPLRLKGSILELTQKDIPSQGMKQLKF